MTACAHQKAQVKRNMQHEERRPLGTLRSVAGDPGHTHDVTDDGQDVQHNRMVARG